MLRAGDGVQIIGAGGRFVRDSTHSSRPRYPEVRRMTHVRLFYLTVLFLSMGTIASYVVPMP
jgi:hypothetical protein